LFSANEQNDFLKYMDENNEALNRIAAAELNKFMS